MPLGESRSVELISLLVARFATDVVDSAGRVTGHDSAGWGRASGMPSGKASGMPGDVSVEKYGAERYERHFSNP